MSGTHRIILLESLLWGTPIISARLMRRLRIAVSPEDTASIMTPMRVTEPTQSPRKYFTMSERTHVAFSAIFSGKRLYIASPAAAHIIAITPSTIIMP